MLVVCTTCYGPLISFKDVTHIERTKSKVKRSFVPGIVDQNATTLRVGLNSERRQVTLQSLPAPLLERLAIEEKFDTQIRVFFWLQSKFMYMNGGGVLTVITTSFYSPPLCR